MVGCLARSQASVNIRVRPTRTNSQVTALSEMRWTTQSLVPSAGACSGADLFAVGIQMRAGTTLFAGFLVSELPGMTITGFA